MYNTINTSLNAKISINEKVDRKWKVKSNFAMSCLTFKSSISTLYIFSHFVFQKKRNLAFIPKWELHHSQVPRSRKELSSGRL